MTVMDKEVYYKAVVTKVCEKLDLSGVQGTVIMDVITEVMADVKLVLDKNQLATNLCENSVILKNFLGCKKLAGCKKSTLEAYRYAILKFTDYSNIDLLRVTTDDIRRYLLFCQNSSTNGTVDNARRVLNTFFQFMEDEGYISKNPCRRINRIKESHRVRRFYTEYEMECMRDACVDKKELALVDMLIATGLRVSEVSNAKISSIDWKARTITVIGKGDKERIVPMSTRCVKHLKEYINGRRQLSEYLFCSTHAPYGKMDNKTIEKMLHTIGKRVGLEDITVHGFRRYLATNLRKKGTDPFVIQYILGHASYTTTQNHYLSDDIEKVVYEYNCA